MRAGTGFGDRPTGHFGVKKRCLISASMWHITVQYDCQTVQHDEMP